MKLFKWTSDLQTGIEIIDAQHKELGRRINVFLKRRMAVGVRKSDLVSTFDFLRIFVLEHFSTEEKIMHDYDYPSLESHQREHAKIVTWVRDVYETLDKREFTTDFNLEVDYFLVDWMQKHFKAVDRQYVDYLKKMAAEGKDHRLRALFKGLTGR